MIFVVSSARIRPTLIARRSARRIGGGNERGFLVFPSLTSRSPLLPYPYYFNKSQHIKTIRSLSQTAASSANEEAVVVPDPTSQQLRAYFWTCAAPMFGFGFMDNTIMILAGNYLDLTIGVAFGLSTLAAAAMGQLVANASSVLFGDTVETFVRSMGLPSSGLSSPQRRLRKVRRVGVMGSLIGVVCGATLGLVSLLFVDTKQSTRLKLEALSKEQEFEFEIDVSNKQRRDATTVTVTGPDVDGVLASLTAAITSSGYSLVELHAASRDHADGTHIVEDVFILRPRGQSIKGQIDDRDLDELGQILLAACRDPLLAHSLKTQIHDLKSENELLKDRAQFLENVITAKQIKIERNDLPGRMTMRRRRA